MNPIIIEQPWGGLGDNLQYSTLPELGHKYGIDVYVSDNNKYRNQDIKKLVWDTNPFLKGFINEPGNIGHYQQYEHSFNVIMNWEKKIFGEVHNDSPKLYYQPNLKPKYSNKIIIDDNAFSRPIDFSDVIKNYPDAILLNKFFGKNTTVLTSSIFEWVDILFSAEKVICQYSGASVLLPAYNKGATIFMKHHDNTYKFKQNTYINL